MTIGAPTKIHTSGGWLKISQLDATMKMICKYPKGASTEAGAKRCAVVRN